MAFTVEDGTGVEEANSLCSVEFADTYFAERLNTAWTGTAEVKQAALIRATDYIEGRWSCRFAGERQFEEQGLSFPRLYIEEDGVVPTLIKRATCEYAVRALSGALAPDPTVDASGMPVQRIKEKVGPIETETQYQAGIVAGYIFKPYPAADMLLRPYLVRSGSLVRS